MLTSIFKNNLISYISIPVLGILLWTLSFYNRSLFLPIKLNIGIDSYSISILYIYIITYVITILTGFFINSKVKKHLFSYEPSNLTFLFYVLLISLSISATSYFWIILSTIIIALILQYLFVFYENKTINNNLFNSSFLIGILAIIYPPFLLLSLFLFISYSSVNKLTVRHISIIIIASFLPLFYVFLFSSLTNNTDVIPLIFNLEFTTPTFNWKTIVLAIMIITISIYGYSIAIGKRSATDTVSLRITKAMFYLLIFSIIIAVFNILTNAFDGVFIIIAIPSAILIAAFFMNSSSIKKEILFVLLLFFCVFYR